MNKKKDVFYDADDNVVVVKYNESGLVEDDDFTIESQDIAQEELYWNE